MNVGHDFELVHYEGEEEKAEKEVEEGIYKALLILSVDEEELPMAT